MPSCAPVQFGVVLIVGSVAAADFESLIGPGELGLVGKYENAPSRDVLSIWWPGAELGLRPISMINKGFVSQTPSAYPG